METLLRYYCFKNAAVRYGRVPKRCRGGEQSPRPSSSEQVEEVETVKDEEFEAALDVARIVAAAHRANNTYTEELRQTLQVRPLNMPGSIDKSCLEEATSTGL